MATRYQPGKGLTRNREPGESRSVEIPRNAGAQRRPSIGFDERTDEIVVVQRGGSRKRRKLYER